MVYIHGEEHALLNIDMTDRMEMNLISYYRVTLVTFKKHSPCTKIEAM